MKQWEELTKEQQDKIPWYPCEVCKSFKHPTDAHDFCIRATHNKAKE